MSPPVIHPAIKNKVPLKTKSEPMTKHFSQNEWWLAIVSSDTTSWNQWFEKNKAQVSTPKAFEDAQGATPLHWACLMKNKEATENLLRAGASIWAQDQEGNFPFRIAMNHGESLEWNWSQWSKLFPKCFTWTGAVHPANRAIARHLFSAAQQEKWNEVDALMEVVSYSSCPQLIWDAPHESTFSKVFKAMGPMPWVHGAILLQSEIFLKKLTDWGAPLMEQWGGYSMDDMSQFLTQGLFTPVIHKFVQKHFWPNFNK